jgi:hypothetical protein
VRPKTVSGSQTRSRARIEPLCDVTAGPTWPSIWKKHALGQSARHSAFLIVKLTRCLVSREIERPKSMASPIHGERNGARARFRLHAQSSNWKMRAALNLTGRQQDPPVAGEKARHSNGEVKGKTYTLPRHNANLARPR